MRLIAKIISGALILIGMLVVVTLYSVEAHRLGLIEPMRQQSTDPQSLFFALVMSAPVLVIGSWPFVVRSELLLPPVKIGDVRWRIVVTKWRVALLAALIGLMVLRLVG